MVDDASQGQKAKEWRKSNRLSREALSQLTAYSAMAIYWFEQDKTPSSRGPIKPNVWRRYQMACAGVQQLLAGYREFNWKMPDERQVRKKWPKPSWSVQHRERRPHVERPRVDLFGDD